LLALLGLPFVSPLLASITGDNASLPACCRRNGAHHCMNMVMQLHPSSSDPHMQAPPEKCPYYPASVAVFHGNAFVPPTAQVIFAGLIAHPAVVAQTESKLRISRERSRQKRGPPSLSL
jgi:hypothetical protein